jgi:hypothetical protein
MTNAPTPNVLELTNESIFFLLPDELANAPEFFRSYRGFSCGVVWDVWAVTPVEDMEAGMRQGVSFADQLMSCAKANQRPDLIQHVETVLLNRIDCGTLRFGFIECGFFRRLGHLAYLAAHD